MLDVHPPHHPTHGWRDFFVHIATITVGLLIAIGLEQTVEAMHNSHQRHILVESLLHDTGLCVRDSRDAAHFAEKRNGWLRARRKQVNEALWSARPLGPPPAQPLEEGYEDLSDPQWQAGKASGLLQLLSTEDTEAFSEIDSMIQSTTNATNAFQSAANQREAYEASFADRSSRGMDFSQASSADLREYLRLLSDEIRASDDTRGQALQTMGASAAVFKGERNHEQIQEAERREVRTALPPPTP
jgi:hypothetical protein